MYVYVPLVDVFEIGKINNDVELEKLFVWDYPVYHPIFENNKFISLIKCNNRHYIIVEI